MVTLSGVVQNLWGMAVGLVPAGVQPIHFWLTFMITLAIVFLLLQFIKIFEDHRGSAFIVAVVISYFVASSAFATIIIAKLFPNVGIALMAILGLMMVIALLSPSSISGGTNWSRLIVLIALVFVIWATYSSVAPELQAAGVISSTGGGGVSISDQDAATIVAALIVIGVVYMIVSPKKDNRKSFLRDFFNALKGKEL
ncbi:MAG: hypothetical protein J7K73_03645 [Nanoarchaeota archaeon]|nr:hypothetical protein [Nanoarchaeota archaeon]